MTVSTMPITGTFGATGQSGNAFLIGAFNVSLWGTFDATVKIERSFDAGSTWLPVSRDAAGTEAAFTAPASVVCEESEGGVLYRLNCTAFTSGPVNYRVSQ